jgi:hypothetical protein
MAAPGGERGAGLGLAYRQRDSLNINGLGLVTNGIEFRQSIIDYSPR